MRQVQLQEVEEHAADLIAEAESGASITILKAGRPVAQIIPFADPVPEFFSESERQAARAELKAITARGYDLGVVWNGRDELYDRD